MAEESTLSSYDGLKLHTRTWHPAEGETTKGRLVLVHGLGEHSGRYEHVAAALNSAGIAVYALDNRGHGRSEGLRGHVDGWDQFVKDARQLVDLARSDGDEPCFLYGHSMGGLIGLRLLQTQNEGISGAIISNPSLRVAFDPPKLKILAGRLLARVLPRLRLDNELKTEDICRDSVVVAEYQNDPLVHRHVSTRWYTSFVEAQAAANAEPEAIQVPMLWVISGGDRLCHAGWNQEFSGKLPATSTEVKLFPDAFHEAHNGPDKAKVIAAMVAWLKTQTAA